MKCINTRFCIHLQSQGNTLESHKHKILFPKCSKSQIFTEDRIEMSHDEFEDFLVTNMSKEPGMGVSGENVWKCLVCGKCGVNKIDISRHIESTHVSLPPVICSICNKWYKTKKSLRTHQNTFHEGQYH